jgi:C-terminal processing protease CtpA/Prc
VAATPPLPPDPTETSSDPLPLGRRSPRSVRRWAAALTLTLVLCGLIAGGLAGRAAAVRARAPFARAALLAEILSTIERDYYLPMHSEALNDAAVRGVVASLDSQSRWLTAEQVREVKEEASGVESLPASAGAADPASGIVGPSQTVRAELAPGGVAYVRVVQFRKGTAAAVNAAVDALVERGPLSGMVLDLRDNPGGLLSEAVAVADLFLDDGPIVTTRLRGAAGDEVFLATPGGFPLELSLVVLVNGQSASASEVVAGAVQDTGRGTLVGERTYGKGTVQQVYVPTWGDESALRLTVGQYYTPSGAPVAPRDGRVPDLVVPYPVPASPLDALRARIDALEDPAAREELRGLVEQVAAASVSTPRTSRAVIPWDLPLTGRMESDPQLRAAFAALAERP